MRAVTSAVRSDSEARMQVGPYLSVTRGYACVRALMCKLSLEFSFRGRARGPQQFFSPAFSFFSSCDAGCGAKRTEFTSNVHVRTHTDLK